MIPSEFAIELAEDLPWSVQDIEYFLRKCPASAPPQLVRASLEMLEPHHSERLPIILRAVADAMEIERL